MVSSKCQNEAHTLPSVVVRTSFKIFRALFGVRPRMRRLSQALQIECSCIKHELTVQIIFMSEIGVNKCNHFEPHHCGGPNTPAPSPHYIKVGVSKKLMS